MQHLDSNKKAAILLKDKIPFRKMLFWLVKYIKVHKYYKHYGLYKDLDNEITLERSFILLERLGWIDALILTTNMNKQVL